MIRHLNERLRPLAHSENGPQVAISCRADWCPTKQSDTLLALSAMVIEAGGRPFWLTPEDGEGPQLDALILPGGVDPHPSTYRQEMRGTRDEDLNVIFDRWEIGLVQRCLQLDLPILGSCRGAQILNIAGGGTLHQDITVQPAAALASVVEGALTTFLKHDGDKNLFHPVRVATGSRLYTLVGAEVQVNSIHHQCVDELAPCFVAVAFSEDGVVEAFESVGGRQTGCQFHPEVLASSDPRFNGLVTHLIQDARAVGA